MRKGILNFYLCNMKFVSIDIPYLGQKYFRQLTKLPGITSVGQSKEPPATDEEIIDRIGDAELVTCDITTQITKKVLANCDNVKAIFCQSVGYDHIDVDYAKEKGIKVFNCAGYNSTAVAEFAFALMTSLYRRIPSAQSHVRAGGWSYQFFVGGELRGKTIGIIGSGNVAQKIAAIARGYSMKVVATTAHPSVEKAESMKVSKFISLEKLLHLAHFVVVAVPLNFQTKNLLGAEELLLMRKDAVLVNVARHTIVDENAVANAVLEKRIAGVALDMMFKEPFNVKEYPMKIQEFVRLPNVIVTPHIAGISEESGKKLGEVFVQNVKIFLAGGLENCVNC